MSTKAKSNPYIGRTLDEDIQSYIARDPAYEELLKAEVTRLELARLIKLERERHGWSQEQLAS